MLDSNAKSNSDPKVKRYISSIDKILLSFDSINEWADIIAFLTKLTKAIEAFPNMHFIPRKFLVNKRLAQCLNPSLPTGVHHKVIDAYDAVCRKIRETATDLDIEIILTSVLPFFEHANTLIRSRIVYLLDKFLITFHKKLDFHYLQIISGLLAGLEDPTNENFNAINTLFEKEKASFIITICQLLSSCPKYRHAIILLLSGERFQNIFKLIDDHIYENFLACLSNGLADANNLVVRGIIDFILANIPLRSINAFHISMLQRSTLVFEMLKILLRKEMSLNRRIYQWLLDIDQSGNESLSKLSLDLINNCLITSGNFLKSNDQFNIWIKILIYILDKSIIGDSIIKTSCFELSTIIHNFYLYGNQDPNTTLNVANSFLSLISLESFWDSFSRRFAFIIKRSDTESNLSLLAFILKHFDIVDKHIIFKYLDFILKVTFNILINDYEFFDENCNILLNSLKFLIEYLISIDKFFIFRTFSQFISDAFDFLKRLLEKNNCCHFIYSSKPYITLLFRLVFPCLFQLCSDKFIQYDNILFPIYQLLNLLIASQNTCCICFPRIFDFFLHEELCLGLINSLLCKSFLEKMLLKNEGNRTRILFLFNHFPIKFREILIEKTFISSQHNDFTLCHTYLNSDSSFRYYIFLLNLIKIFLKSNADHVYFDEIIFYLNYFLKRMQLPVISNLFTSSKISEKYLESKKSTVICKNNADLICFELLLMLEQLNSSSSEHLIFNSVNFISILIEYFSSEEYKHSISAFILESQNFFRMNFSFIWIRLLLSLRREFSILLSERFIFSLFKNISLNNLNSLVYISLFVSIFKSNISTDMLYQCLLVLFRRIEVSKFVAPNVIYLISLIFLLFFTQNSFESILNSAKDNYTLLIVNPFKLAKVILNLVWSNSSYNLAFIPKDMIKTLLFFFTNMPLSKFNLDELDFICKNSQLTTYFFEGILENLEPFAVHSIKFLDLFLPFMKSFTLPYFDLHLERKNLFHKTIIFYCFAINKNRFCKLSVDFLIELLKYAKKVSSFEYFPLRYLKILNVSFFRLIFVITRSLKPEELLGQADTIHEFALFFFERFLDSLYSNIAVSSGLTLLGDLCYFEEIFDNFEINNLIYPTLKIASSIFVSEEKYEKLLSNYLSSILKLKMIKTVDNLLFLILSTNINLPFSKNFQRELVNFFLVDDSFFLFSFNTKYLIISSFNNFNIYEHFKFSELLSNFIFVSLRIDRVSIFGTSLFSRDLDSNTNFFCIRLAIALLFADFILIGSNIAIIQEKLNELIRNGDFEELQKSLFLIKALVFRKFNDSLVSIWPVFISKTCEAILDSTYKFEHKFSLSISIGQLIELFLITWPEHAIVHLNIFLPKNGKLPSIFSFISDCYDNSLDQPTYRLYEPFLITKMLDVPQFIQIFSRLDKLLISLDNNLVDNIKIKDSLLKEFIQ